MKLKKGVDLVALLEEIKTCQGGVCFVTDEGDRLNLKSMLSQYLFVALTGNSKLLEQGRVNCENKQDYRLLEHFLTE